MLINILAQIKKDNNKKKQKQDKKLFVTPTIYLTS